MCITLFLVTFNFIYLFYNAHNEKDEHCLSIHTHFSIYLKKRRDNVKSTNPRHGI